MFPLGGVLEHQESYAAAAVHESLHEMHRPIGPREQIS